MSKLELHSFTTPLVPAPVEYAVVLPDDYDPSGEALPLCLNLHGGGLSRDALVEAQPLLDGMWEQGVLPPMVVAMCSVDPIGFYVDVREGPQWLTLVEEAFPAHLRERYRVRRDGAGTALTGASMGGLGSLKLAFRHPERYAAVAAMEPAVEPGFDVATLTPRNLFYRNLDKDREIYGDPIDGAHWAANNPASLVVEQAAAIRDSGIKIYIEVGDEDELNLHDGAEFLHRVLWDSDIPHEYRLIRGAGHVGPSLAMRMLDTFEWLGRALAGADEERDAGPFDEAEQDFIAWLERGMAPPAPTRTPDMMGPRGRRMLLEMNKEQLAAARVADPTTDRRYGRLPPTGTR